MGSAVLLVHDERQLRDAARKALEFAGHSVTEADDLPAAWRAADAGRPELITLPWTAGRGLRDALSRLRDQETTRLSRVIIWAPQRDMREAINALEFGADDCLALPLEPSELVARVNACLRRPPAITRPDLLTAGPLVLDKGVHCLLVDGQLVALAPAEFRLLAFLLENQGRVFSRDELLLRAWSKNIKAGHRTVDVHVRRLRQLLEPFGCDGFIQTVRGFGYRLAPVTKLKPEIHSSSTHHL
jgi:two-component system, OmpR family, phosphate regulon response regulator PhoB